MTQHRLGCSPSTVHWGFLEASLPDVLVVSPGDRVSIDTISGGAAELPADRLRYSVLDDHLAVIGASTPRLGPHPLTGPIGVRGAEPGDVLHVTIEQIELRQNWGWIASGPSFGLLPELETDDEILIVPIDLSVNELALPWGSHVSAAPFFGVMAVKPSPESGAITSLIPGVFGGNMDIRELRPGVELCLPVQAAGAGFSIGDGHALQGDGETVGTAVETALVGEFSIALEKGAAQVTYPYALMPGRLLTIAVDEDVDIAAEQAVRQAVALLRSRYGLSAKAAYYHTSLLGNLSISQVVNVKKGVHFSVSLEGIQD